MEPSSSKGIYSLVRRISTKMRLSQPDLFTARVDSRSPRRAKSTNLADEKLYKCVHTATRSPGAPRRPMRKVSEEPTSSATPSAKKRSSSSGHPALARQMSSEARGRCPSLTERRSNLARRGTQATMTSFDETLGMRFGLRLNQRAALRKSWDKIGAAKLRGRLVMIQRVLDSVYTDSTIRNIFVQNAFVKGMSGVPGNLKTRHDHNKAVLMVIDLVLDNLDNEPTDTMKFLFEVGRKHEPLKNFGFSHKYWDRFGEKFLDVLVVQESIKRNHEAIRSWTILIAGIVDAITAGYLRRSSQQKNLVQPEVIV